MLLQKLPLRNLPVALASLIGIRRDFPPFLQYNIETLFQNIP